MPTPRSSALSSGSRINRTAPEAGSLLKYFYPKNRYERRGNSVVDISGTEVRRHRFDNAG